MKFYSYLILLILFATSCDNSDPTDGLGDDSSFFNCKIDGKDHDISGFYAYAVEDGSEFTVYGNEDLVNLENAKFVYFIISEDKGSGKYTLGSGEDGIGYHTDKNSTFTYYTIPEGSSGEVNITEKSTNRIKGTFSFTPIDPDTGNAIKITDGTFDVEIRK